jgi:hypothetical protein
MGHREHGEIREKKLVVSCSTRLSEAEPSVFFPVFCFHSPECAIAHVISCKKRACIKLNPKYRSNFMGKVAQKTINMLL